jgi:hypothetical protein
VCAVKVDVDIVVERNDVAVSRIVRAEEYDIENGSCSGWQIKGGSKVPYLSAR